MSRPDRSSANFRRCAWAVTSTYSVVDGAGSALLDYASIDFFDCLTRLWGAAMPKIDIAAVPERKGSGYPKPFDAPCAARTRRRLGDAGGLRDFGVNLMTLPPGAWSSQRHWHSHEDEFVYVLEGEVTLVEDEGRTVLRAGECAAFPKGTGNGHHLINESSAVAVYLEVGSRHPDDVTTCSDIDMKSANADGRFVHKDGSPYE